MYVLLLANGARLCTSDARGLRLYDVTDEPRLLHEVAEPGQRPFFEQSAAGERLTSAGDLIARSFTPEAGAEHWTKAASHVGLYAASDLAIISRYSVGQRLDHESLALSPDGSRLASVSRGGGPVLFDAATGAHQWSLRGEIGSGSCFSPDGRWLAMGETGQGGGFFALIDSTAVPPVKHELPAPSSDAGLYDSPFRAAFSQDGGIVVFTGASWGQGGVTSYDVASRTQRWAVSMPTTDAEDAESWLAPELALALDDQLVIAVQDGLAQAFAVADGSERSRLEYARADARYFAADSARRRLWFTRDGQPTFASFPDDWR